MTDLSTHGALRRMKVQNSLGDELEIPAPPAQWSEYQADEGTGVPTVGMHTEKIRREFMDSK